VRIVVTGGSGKAGRWVVRHLRGLGHDVLNVDVVRDPGGEGESLLADLTNAGQTLVNLDGSGTVDLNGTALSVGGGAFSGVISGTGSYIKTGAGTATLSGANTYSGGTTVSSGALIVNNSSGSGTGSAAVTIKSGATLAGSGSMAGALTLEGGSHLAPGNSPGTLTVNANVAQQASAVLDFDLANVTTVGGGVNVQGTEHCENKDE